MSSDDIAKRLGLSTWVCDGEGIGGLLKVRAEDFRVYENSKIPSLDPKGRFTVAKITLKDWETNRFTNRLARALKISRNRIWFSGNKDKRAVTTQLFVIDAKATKVAEVEIKDVNIEVLGRSHQKLAMGAHDSNRFTITVRGCCSRDGEPLSEEDAMAEIERIKTGLQERVGAGKFPNWVGPQRFGAQRPVTPIVGRHLVNGDFAAAVNEYLGMAGIREQEDVAKFRHNWRDQKDPQSALDLAPQHLGFEKSMLGHLNNNPEDWVGAFKKLPKNLQLMMIHSLQSLTFNHILAARITNNMSLIEPSEGDIVGPVDDSGKIESGRMALVESDTLERCVRNCDLNRLVVTGALPGSEGSDTSGEIQKLESSVIQQLDLDKIDWQIEEIPRLTSRGSRRALTGSFTDFSIDSVPAIQLSEDSRWAEGPKDGDRWHPEGCSIRFRFTLPPGTYATTLLREFTRAPIHQ